MTLKLRTHRSRVRWYHVVPVAVGAVGGALAAILAVYWSWARRAGFAEPMEPMAPMVDDRMVADTSGGVVTARAAGEPASRYTPSEQTIMGDGQLGGNQLARHPDDVNPEGAYYLSNKDSRQGRLP